MLPRQRTFEWDKLDLGPEPVQVNDPVRGRYYVSPNGVEMESVTTFLGRIGDKSHLIKWRERLGDEEADRQTQAAARRGTLFHTTMEEYLTNTPGWKQRSMAVPLFRQVKPAVDLCVGKIRAQEVRLYSTILNLAGTVDLVADWKNRLSVIDWKSSTKIKKVDWITGYFMQTCIYSLMLQERTGLKADQLVVVIGTEQASKPSIFVEERSVWVPRVLNVIRLFGSLSIPQKDTSWQTSTSTA